MLEHLELPPEYLRAIGRIAVYFNYMDAIVNIILMYVCGMDLSKDESHVIFPHMSFRQKLDILSSIGVMNKPNQKYDLKDFKSKVSPLLEAANTNRNIMLHGIWGLKNGVVTKASITARGKLKFTWNKTSLQEIEVAQKSLEAAIVALGTIVSKESFNEATKPPHSGQ